MSYYYNGRDGDLAERIRRFQFRDIRPKAASELPVEHASRLLGHSEKEITERVYRRLGEELHGLRMLSQYVFTHLPLASADSTSIARNVGVDSRWTGTYTPASKESRAAVMRNRIEAHQSLTFLSDDLRMAKTVQIGLFDLM